MRDALTPRQRWLALLLLCLGEVMIVLDSTIVNVALPSIRTDLGFSETSLVWVVNAYLLTFGGFLLLGGRLGDYFGQRRLFLAGITAFTIASLACGLATSQAMLIVARAAQGVGGAVVSAVALSLTMNLFPEPAERAKAMGIYGFVCAGGGSVGVLLGGLLTGAVSWHWIFLVNLPIGVAVYAASAWLLPATPPQANAGRIDWAGAGAVTAALMLAVYAVVNGNEAGWMSVATLTMFAAAAVLMALFLRIESRVVSPVVPLGLFRLRNIWSINLIAVLWAAGMFAWFFISALYLQLVLDHSPMQVGLAFLPSNVIMGVLSIGVSAKLVQRFGIRAPLSMGLVLGAIGLALFARAPVDGNVWRDVMPGMVLLGLGSGIAFNPLLLAAMGDVGPADSGLASGLVNTSFMMGGALGLAVLASLAAAQSAVATAAGATGPEALAAGFRVAFAVGAGFATLAALLSVFVVRELPGGPVAEGTPSAVH